MNYKSEYHKVIIKIGNSQGDVRIDELDGVYEKGEAFEIADLINFHLPEAGTHGSHALVIPAGMPSRWLR